MTPAPPVPVACHRHRAEHLWAGVLAAACAVAGWAAPAGAQASGAPASVNRPAVLIYGGDSRFPPYEYLDEGGRPRGFNVELIKAISGRSGAPIEIRLGPWSDILTRFDGGEVDLVSLAYSDARAARYRLLFQTWTLKQAIFFRPGRAQYPRALDELGNEVVAVERASLVADLLRGLPEVRRPTLVEQPSQEESLAQVASGAASAAAGNELTLMHAAHARDLGGFVSVPVKSLSYHLVARRGTRVDVAAIQAALDAIKASGDFDRLVEANLATPGRADRGSFREAAAASALAVVAIAAGIGWNWSLRRLVRRQTLVLRKSLVDLQASVAERDAAFSALGASESRYRSLIENMISGLITTDANGRIDEVNPAAARAFGYAQEELRGQPLAMLVPVDDHERAQAFLREAFKLAIGRVTQWEGRRKNGEVFPLELSLFSFGEGGRRAVAGTLLDISERRQIDRMKDEFVSVVSHELRTPLTSIKAAMQLLLADEGMRSGEEGRQLVEVALNNTDRLVRIVNDMLDVAKIEAGGLELRLRPTTPLELVEHAIFNVAPLARSLDVGIAPVVTADLAPFPVDPDRIVQALVNLLSNALKFAPRHSTVTVGAAATEASAVRFWVHDSGRGIPPEQMPRLFRKFEQVDSSDSRPVPGTGLGLTITKAIVEQHHGRIGVTSVPGQGTTFSFELPVARPEAVGAAVAAQPAA